MGAARTCIYCRGRSDGTVGREHVMPEALGNPDWTLPVGAVRDECNNWLRRKVDAPFVNSGIGAMRSMLGIPGKKGRS